jgi:hypothetical protein
MGCFGLTMIYTWSTTKTHPNNANDDKRWGTTKRLECQQGMTKWQQMITWCKKGMLETLGALGWTWKLSFRATRGIKMLKVEGVGYDVKGHKGN